MSFFQKQIGVFILISAFLINLSCTANSTDQKVIDFWAMGAEGEQVQKLLPEFERQNPNIKVKVQMVPWTAAQEKLITAYASENLPDCFQLGNTWIPQFAALNAIEPLDKWISLSGQIKKNNYFSGIWDTNLLDSTVYGIPWYIDTRVLFYRKDILKQAGYDHPPRTWDELYDVSKKIRNLHPNQEKYAIYMPTNEWAPFVIFGLQLGAKLLRDHDSYGNFSGDKFKKAFKFLIKFHEEKLAPVGISQVTNVYQAFADEYFAMYISGPWNVREFERWMTGNLKNSWMTAPLPGPDKNTPGVSLAGGSSLVISRNSENKEAVWKLIEYLSLPRVQIEFYKLVTDLPAVKTAWNDSTLKNNPYMNAFYEQFQHVVPTPKIPEWEQIAFSKIQQYAEFAARGAMTIDEALNALDRDVDKILEKRRWLIAREQSNDP